MHRKALLLLVGSCLSWNVYAQDITHQPNQGLSFKQAIELYDAHRYQAARERFDEYLKLYPDGHHEAEAAYFQAISALRAEHKDGEHLLDGFINEYPTHPKAKLAYFELGNFYFDKGQYRDAIRFFEKVEKRQLSNAQASEWEFNLGYSYFSRKQFDQALVYFNQVKRSDNPFTYAASYYAGFISYGKDDYDRALIDLERAGENAAYSSVVPYMIANVYYRQEQFDALLEYGQQVLANGNAPENAHLIQLLLAEAAYNKNDFALSARYYKDYLSTGSVSSTPEILYKAGYAHYKSNQSGYAIEAFEKAAVSKDTVGQYASYYLGVLYLEDQNTQYAVAAFDKASTMNFVPGLKEDASFHLAKVHFESGNTSAAIETLSDFIEDYPGSKYSQEAGELLSEAYLHTTNYAKAVEHIESLPSQTYTVRKAYQKVTYLYGTQLFNQGEFYHAVQMFDKSLKHAIDKDIVVMANFWSAEAYSVGKKYEEAIASYAGVFRNTSSDNIFFQKSRYGIGYAYFNSQQYDKALTHFKHYVDNLEKSKTRLFYEDALLRLADCYYANKGYNNALAFYDKAIDEGNPEKDYAYFQKGMVNGIQGKLQEAKRHFDLVLTNHKESRYVDDALFHKAQFDFVNTNYAVAANEFTYLIEQKPESPFVPYAYLRRAISSTNLKNHEQSAKDYKHLLDEYMSHKLADDAILGLQDALAALGRNDEIEPYLERYKTANPKNEAVAEISFESAKSLYFAQKYEGAISKFKTFIESYPENSMSFEAKYYIADSYYRSGNEQEAIRYFKEVIDAKHSRRVSRSVQRIAELNYALKNYSEAISYFKKLEEIARNKKEQYVAWAGQMQAYYDLEKYDLSDKFARLVIERGNVSVNATNQAQLYLGKAAYQRGDYDKAIDEFLTTLNTAKDIHGAEAQYLMAEIFYQKGLYEQSIEALFDLNTNFSIYSEWLGKSFLLISDNYMAMGENFQARATLNSVIEKSKVAYVVSQAKKKIAALDQLEKEEKERKAKELKQKQDSLQYEEIDPKAEANDSLK